MEFDETSMKYHWLAVLRGFSRHVINELLCSLAYSIIVF